MTQEIFLKRYEKYSEDVQEYMKMLSQSIMEKYQEIPDVFVISLDVLAGNLTIMTKAMKSIAYEGGEIVGKDNYRGEKKSTELSAFLATQQNVIKILNAFGFTPIGKSKIKSNTDVNDAAKLLEKLLN